MALIAAELFKLHTHSLQFNNHFNVFDTFNQYFDLLKDKNRFFRFNHHIPEIYDFFNQSSSRKTCHQTLCPCHNDLVPENILIENGKLFFIDWEYSGMNTPLFDIAAFFLESRLSIEKQKYFLSHYDPNLDFEQSRLQMRFHQFTQDVLWFLWTLVKEENNENFDDYAEIRINRAFNIMNELMQNEFI